MEVQNSPSDLHFMRLALNLAEEGLGRVSPNPSVGCILVKDNQIIAQARTADGGRPHAEPQALAIAGDQSHGSTAYVTLEPCSHYGKTPPCAKALIDAKVSRVVIACLDRDERVAGNGVKMLKDAGIDVTCNVLKEEAEDLNCGFFKAIETGMPYVTLKMAVSNNDKIAKNNGAPVRISSDDSILHMHRHLRAHHDAIMIGYKTLVNDNPALTTRNLPAGTAHAIKKFVATQSHDALPTGYTLSNGDNPACLVNGSNIQGMLRELYSKHGVTRILVEGGATLMQAFLSEKLWDQLYLYKNTDLMLPDDAVSAPDFSQYAMRLEQTRSIALDTLAIYVPRD